LSTSVQIGRPGQFREFEAYAREAMERALLRASDRAARKATSAVRDAMRGAGLGRLAGAIGSGSDLAKNGRAHLSGKRISASGWIHIRGHSERTLGALIAATEGATIVPKRGKWLAFATDQIPKRAGRRKMTPELYRTSGLESRIGPLEFVPGRSRREALLIVRDVSVDRFGRKGRAARRLPRRGALGSTRRRQAFIVAFVLIRATTRAARIDPQAIIATVAAEVPEMIAEEFRKDRL
jgi:hypothetical protein